VLILKKWTEHWPHEAACKHSARALALALTGMFDAGKTTSAPHIFIELQGSLGAGKTTFVRHLLQALGVQGRIKSPTYALMEVYEVLGHTVSHFDFYRLNDPQEWEDAGFRDVFCSPGLKLVEWPEQAAGLLPLADLRIFINHCNTDGRAVEFQALTEQAMRLLP
jgi:tRNA threonylcarbamoyladenosine biosynthesis protein TsaE